jgi:hypothetical protein
MHKLLPFRQYDEKDVINLAQLDVSGAAAIGNLKPGGTDATLKNAFWSGSLVDVKSSNTTIGGVGADPALTTNTYLGKIGSADQGFAEMAGSKYPEAPLKLTATVGNTGNFLPIGITLKATLAFDENDEKLLYYRRKLEELQAVLPGETVPVARKGIFTITTSTTATHTDVALADATITPGLGLGVHGTAAQVGQFLCATKAASSLGTILATGKAGGKDIALITFDAGV